MSVSVETAQIFQAGTPTAMFDLLPFYGPTGARIGMQWDIAPEGNRFLILSPSDRGEQQQSRMIVVLNWHEELKRLVPTK